ncbi:hypothetical protein SGUI_2873 [Serinicoccus hydrothermalis]|uniref:AbiEi antitoxin C-terminal domain-containing protein n=2 Tax=Serinicoccus hydrothermalis TaxID=1758689 RepID=A0A1B1NFR9_9MICO|nr:hypothetical protein SGUI_2873 [Serinicoccus hydrothermalis]
MIDLVATHLSLDYYVGWLSAAQLHGAAHQAPQTFQVAVSRQLRDRGIGRTAFQFRLRSDIPKVPVVHHPTRAGQARVSTPESTAVDIATDVTLSGGIDNAATVILELDEVCDLDRFELVRLAATVPAAAVRRMGFTLDRLGGRGGMDDLRALALAGPPTPARLDPSAAATGPVDPRWMVRLNREVEVDW